jgi:molecular chaperone GrpE
MSENEKGNGAAPAGTPSEPPATAPATEKAEQKEAAQSTQETIEQVIDRLEKEKRDGHDRMLRVAAEFENFKKRTRRELDEAVARGREQVAKELLPVLDNFERALSALESGGTVEQLGQGVKLVDKQLHSALEKMDIRPFEALGEAFDPTRHDAIQQMETAEHAPGTVAKVFSRGYTIGSRLLRAAMVAVAKAPADGAKAADADKKEEKA